MESRECYELQVMMMVPSQLPDPKSPSVMPPSGAGGVPSVAADH